MASDAENDLSGAVQDALESGVGPSRIKEIMLEELTGTVFGPLGGIAECRLCGDLKGSPHEPCPSCGKLDREPQR